MLVPFKVEPSIHGCPIRGDHLRALKGASSNDDIARAQRTVRCLQKIRAASISQRQPRHRNTLPHRGRNEGRIAFEEIGNLGSGCKPIWIVVDERVAGKTYEQIGRLKMQTVPPLGSPALRDPAAFDDDMFLPPFRERVAHDEARLASAYDQSIDFFHARLRSSPCRR